MKAVSNWNFPEPRTGLAGRWDRFVGPGATIIEQIMPVAVAMVAAGLALTAAAFQEPGWAAWQWALAAFLAFDLFGGVATLATSSAKRWYHRTGVTKSSHLAFVSAHGLQIGLVAFCFRDLDVNWFATFSLAIVLASAVVMSTPLRFQRSVAYVLACVGVLLGLSVFTPTLGLEWFVPVLFIKLVIAHTTYEEPYVEQKGVAS